MRCICCGLQISEAYHPTEHGDVCDRCWNDPNLFFPERLKEADEVSYIFNFFTSNIKSNETLSLPVMRLNQNGIRLYTGKLPVKLLLKLYSILVFEEESLSGYQRELYESQINEISDYILNCPAPIMPGLFISIREGAKFESSSENSEDIGELLIPLKKGALWIIDGQHRISGFEKILSNIEINNRDKSNQDALEKILEYELPITFLDSEHAIKKLYEFNKLSINFSDVERLAFFIINKTQRRLSPSLKDTLQYVINESGIRGIPTIDKESWRTEAAAIGIDLNSIQKSALFKKINISGQRGLDRPIQLNTFVSSQKPLKQNSSYAKLSLKNKKDFLLKYWSSIKEENKQAFLNASYRDYLLLKAIGVYTLHTLAVDFINLCSEQNLDFMQESNIRKFIRKMRGFDWKKESSPIAALGGMKGVKEARRILIDFISKTE